MMKNYKCLYTLVLFLNLEFNAQAQVADTLNGFKKKIVGDEIKYYSPLHQFAPTALLTRANGKMPIQWRAEKYQGEKQFVCYEILIGSSSGTSSGKRNFEININQQKNIQIQTSPKQSIGDIYQNQKSGISYYFKIEDQDINKDVFGKLYLTIPAKLVRDSACFTLNGIDSNSRDWMMVFMYEKKFDVDIQIANLLLKNEHTRRVNVYAINPYPTKSNFKIQIDNKTHQFDINPGFNQFKIAAFDTSKTGQQSIECQLNNEKPIKKNIVLYPIRNISFHIIHHSHNDIGYSHLQSEVEKIQTQNIRDAIQWIESSSRNISKAYWHIESLWAVENFMKSATKTEQNKFIDYVKNGHIVLSANYANILTGLCQPEEQNWTLEYANKLRRDDGLPIQNIMTTDIPGLSASAFSAYLKNGYPYCSMGPNYVSSQEDLGDRVGGMIKEQGDQIFYWKQSIQSKEKLLVWTAGKGYSYFHGITEQEKQEQWEKRISDYLIELQQKNYPYDLVQLRYTKNADNGPVDIQLCNFVDSWNHTYASPQLTISSIPLLYKEFENKYGNYIKELSGEISPYWEDGAYSTAKEEMQARNLVQKTIQIESFAKSKNKYHQYEKLFYLLHRSLVLFHEHTWGSWCSISDPEITFTTEQWKFKKQFVDSAQIYLDSLLKVFPEKLNETNNQRGKVSIQLNEKTGGLSAIHFNEYTIEVDKNNFDFFQVVYSKGINPSILKNARVLSSKIILDNKEKQMIEQELECENLIHFKQIYTIYKNGAKITCRYIFDKQIEKDKESLHLAFNFNTIPQKLKYNQQLEYPLSQLAGSNKEFICVEDAITLEYKSFDIQIKSPEIALFEIGGIINEQQKNGAKVWKRENQKTNHLFLYVFNNYWHTNYKAYQDGHFDFEVEMLFKKK